MVKKDGAEDLRIKRTKKSIRDAFFELIDEKGYDHTCVKDITQRAMISRNTFYLHYADKHDLFEKICDELTQKLFLKAGDQLRKVRQNEFTLQSVASIIKTAMTTVDDNIYEYRVLFSVSGTSDILTDKINHIARCFIDLIKDDIDGISELSMAYIVSGITGVIKYHVLHGANDIDRECENFTRIHLKSIIEIASGTRRREERSQ